MIKPYLEAGKIVAVHGVRGELRAQYWCDSPAFLAAFQTLYWDGAGQHPVGLLSARPHKNVMLLRLEGVDTVEKAQTLIGRVFYIRRPDDALEDGTYFIQDLLGMEVVDADTGARYGVLCDVSETGANDVYHIRFDDGAERLIPAIPQVVVSVDLPGNRMEIRPLEGLFDL